MTNNIEKDEKNNIFVSTSENYKQYYNSLGVFIISPNIDIGNYVKPDKVLGLIIIDSIEKNIFDSIYVRTIMGYIAHRFYDYLTLYPRFKLN